MRLSSRTRSGSEAVDPLNAVVPFSDTGRSRTPGPDLDREGPTRSLESDPLSSAVCYLRAETTWGFRTSSSLRRRRSHPRRRASAGAAAPCATTRGSPVERSANNSCRYFVQFTPSSDGQGPSDDASRGLLATKQSGPSRVICRTRGTASAQRDAVSPESGGVFKQFG
jgi:hypothetical protein